MSDLEGLLSSLLAVLEAELGFAHSMVLLLDESGRRLYTVASLGYGDGGIGAEVAVGQGLIGTVAQERKILRLSDVDGDMRYGRAIRREVRSQPGGHALSPEIPLPGLADAQSYMAIPLLVRDRLVGVLAVESRDSLGFEEWHEAFLGIVANQAAVAIENAMLRDDAEEGPAPARMHATARRTEFTNRELRLDPSLGLPAIKDNLESRLILLRKRLEQKCPDLSMVPKCRGQFRLEVDCSLELVEKDSG
jgi:GAF domain-containing protein